MRSHLEQLKSKRERSEPYAYGYAADILSAYEDTGLSPSQIMQMQKENTELKRLLTIAEGGDKG